MPESIKALLETVMDPEIPTISIVDLGIVTEIASPQPGHAIIELTPTFSGCPALRIMEQMVHDKLAESGYTHIEVKTTFNKQWNTNMISEKGLIALKQHGLAPHPNTMATLSWMC